MPADEVDALLRQHDEPTRPDVRAAVRTVLTMLRDTSGLGSWAVARVVGDDWTLVDVLDDAYGLHPGYTVRYAGTLCRAMVLGLGPRIAPDVAQVPAYESATLRRTLRIGAYAGAPLYYDGELVGTVFGLHPVARSRDAAGWAGLLDSMAGVLGTLVGLDLTTEEISRRAARAEVEAHVDPLTQIGNRLAWSKVLMEQEARCQRYQRSACVLSVDLDGLKLANDRGGHAVGDRLLRRAALVLRRVSRLCDHVARVGGDEFAVLAVEASEEEGKVLLARLRAALAAAGVEASVGMAAREEQGNLEAAWRAADVAMYAEKRRRLGDRVIRALVDPDSVSGRTIELPVRRLAMPMVEALRRA